MSRVERVRDLRAEFQYLTEWQGAPLKPRRQRLAFDVLHHQVVDTVLMTDIVNDTDMRMVQTGNDLGFALEALFSSGIVRELRRENLDRDGTFEPCVASAVDLAHSTGAELRADFVGTEYCSGSQSHVGARL